MNSLDKLIEVLERQMDEALKRRDMFNAQQCNTLLAEAMKAKLLRPHDAN
jgi:hypothetical protein